MIGLTTYSLRKLTFALLAICSQVMMSTAFSVGTNIQEIFGVSTKGWKDPDWKWGSDDGCANQCASACRTKFSTHEAREELVTALIEYDNQEVDENLSFEEIKFILALAWHKARKEAIYGEAYGQVLDELVKAERYEHDDDEANSRLLVQDLQKRYMWLQPDVEDKILMNMLW